MFFIYEAYDLTLGEKIITSTLKDDPQPRQFTLRIYTPGVKFLWLPMGGGLVKMSHVYTRENEVIHPRKYSKELKEEVKAFKKTLPIPYLKIWKGYLIIAALIAVLFVGSSIYRNVEQKDQANKTAKLYNELHHIAPGQLYGAVFFTDANRQQVNGLPEGWIKVEKIEGDTLFIRRSRKVQPLTPVFDIANIAAIKPASEADWETETEKIDYRLMQKAMEQENSRGIDLQYTGSDKEKYRGAVLTIKGVE